MLQNTSIKKSIYLGLASLSFMLSTEVFAQTKTVDSQKAFRVCADPHNLPYSDDKGQGFENKIADLFAKKLGLPLEYTFYPQSMGFIRNTLNAKKCDVVVGIPTGFDMTLNTEPYYTSTYVMVYRSDLKRQPKNINHDELDNLKIGVIAGTPPVDAIVRVGLGHHLTSYPLVVDTRYEEPAENIINDVVNKKIDVAFIWGPIVGHHVKSHPELVLVKLNGKAQGVIMEFPISMGVRMKDKSLQIKLNQMLKQNKSEIDKILLDYNVPTQG